MKMRGIPATGPPGFPVAGLLLAGAGLLACAAPGGGASPRERHRPASGELEAGGYTHMGPHMRVTGKRPPRPGDLDRAGRIVEQTRRVIAKYEDHRLAVEDGYKPFLAQLPLPEYHFTNYWHGFEASLRFSVERPTSLLYVRERGGYRLTGLMFRAGARASLEELDRRLPLSVAQWHLHTAICLPPRARGGELFRRNPRFGFAGSISTRPDCEEAGGRFFPHLFGWMVHVYPYEERTEDVFRIPGHHDHGEEPPAEHGQGGGHEPYSCSFLRITSTSAARCEGVRMWNSRSRWSTPVTVACRCASSSGSSRARTAAGSASSLTASLQNASISALRSLWTCRMADRQSACWRRKPWRWPSSRRSFRAAHSARPSAVCSSRRPRRT